MKEEKQSFLQKLLNGIQNKSVTHYVREEPPAPPTPSVDLDRFAEAIGYNETRGVKGDPYKFSRNSGNPKLGKALGKYQITEGDLKTYGKRYLGQDVTSKAFLASSTAQDNYIKNKAKYYADKGYTADQIADIHRSGYTNSSTPGSSTVQNAPYVSSFKTVYSATTSPARR